MNGKFFFMKSKVARRFLLLFVVSALIPIGILAFFSLRQIADEQREETYRRLHHASKNAGMSVLEGLDLVESEMQVMSVAKDEDLLTAALAYREREDSGKPPRLVRLTHFHNQSVARTILGAPVTYPLALSAQIERLVPGKSLLYTDETGDGGARLFLAVCLQPHDNRQALLIGQINAEYLWDMARVALPPLAELHILRPSSTVLYSTAHLQTATAQGLEAKMKEISVGKLEWSEGNEDYLAAYWSVFLQQDYGADAWRVIVAQTRGTAFATINRMGLILGSVLTLALFVALLLSSINIRRNLEPLARLKAETERVGKGDFTGRVEVNSADEFQDLADSFNSMSDHLGRHFTSLNETGVLIRSILTSLDREKIVATVLTNTGKVVSCDTMNFLLLDGKEGEHPLMFTKNGHGEAAGGLTRQAVSLHNGTLERLRGIRESIVLEQPGDFADILSPLNGCSQYVLVPVIIRNRLTGVLALGYSVPSSLIDEDRIRIRQIADQVATGLANTGLMEELSRLNWGTLTALARTVDAKSSWTAGHSERVTALALDISRAAGLSHEEQDLLHRGGLLHDIGKIGIPNRILDKPSKLTDEEFALLRTHPEMGGRILEPIEAYRNVVPVVVQHHEWVNGGGYPHGLKGAEICIGARVLAVADVYDALIYDRPYRKGWSEERVMSFITERAGLQFDLDVVGALASIKGLL